MRRGLLATVEELDRLVDKLTHKPFDTFHEWLRRRCSLILESTPVTEQHWRAGWQQGAWASGLHAARTTQGRIIDLLVAHHIDRNTAYRDRAIEELRNIARWSTWNDPCHNGTCVDLMTGEAAVAAVIGLDWLWDDLTEPDRLRVLQAVRNKALTPYRQAVRQGAWWYTCYHNWNTVVNGGCGLAALALSDDEPDAAETLHIAREGLTHFFDALGREGGWDEGTGYWGYAMRYLLLFGEAMARTLDDKTVFHSRGMDATGQFPVYFCPNGQPASFGDSAVVPLYGTLYLLVKHFGMPELTWWLDTYSFHRDMTAGGWSMAGLAMLLRPVDAECPPAPEMLNLKVFHQIGWAAIADHWPRPSFYVAAKTGDLSANHSQRDMNSLQVQVDGEMLLVDLGNPSYTREYFTDSRRDFYQAQARGHNTIVVGERDHRIDAQGEILETAEGKDYRWVVCDAGPACGDAVHYVRHVVMALERGKGQTLLVLDELVNPVGEKAEVFWHTFGDLRCDADKMRGVISGQKASLGFALGATVPASLKVEQREVTVHNRIDPLQQRQEKILHLVLPSVQRALVASVFSRGEVGAVKVQQSAGSVRVTAGKAVFTFKTNKRHLHFEGIGS